MNPRRVCAKRTIVVALLAAGVAMGGEPAGQGIAAGEPNSAKKPRTKALIFAVEPSPIPPDVAAPPLENRPASRDAGYDQSYAYVAPPEVAICEDVEDHTTFERSAARLVQCQIADCDCPPASRPGWFGRVKERLRWSHWGYPECFSPAPFGASVVAARDAQIANGLAAKIVLYRYDFFDADTPTAEQLKPHGLQRLKTLAVYLSQSELSLTVETSGNPLLDERRRNQVVLTLEKLGIFVDESRIIVRDVPVGREAAETMAIYRRFLSGSQTGQGVSSGSGTNAASGTGSGVGSGAAPSAR